MKPVPLAGLAPLSNQASGRAAAFARPLWLVVAGGAVAVFLCALPFRWQMLTQPNAQTLANLHALGLSPTFYAQWTLLWETLLVASWVVTGFLIWRRCGSEPMALFTALVLVVFGVGSGSMSPTLRALLGVHPALDVLLHAFEFLAWYGFTLFFYLFPDGRFVPGWTRTLALLWLPIFLVWNFAPQSALAPLNWPPIYSVPVIGFLWVSMAFSQGYRYFKVSGPRARRQTRLVMMAAVTIILLMIATTAIGVFVPGYNPIGEAQASPQALAYLLVQWPLVLVIALLPIAIAAAIMRDRLWEIDRLLSRALVYTLLTLFVVLAYVLIVGGLSALLPTSGNLLVSLVVTGLIAVVFHPLQMRLHGVINRMLYGQRDDPYTVLADLSRRLDTALDTPTTLQTIVETIRRALHLPAVAILLQEGAKSRLAASAGDALGEPLVLPLTHQREQIGALHVAPRAPDEPFTQAELHLLASIAAQVGIAVHNIRLARDLQHSREQIVSAREEERRRLRRDLHDGLGPRLAGQTLYLEAALDALDAETGTARALLSEMLGESQALIGEIRRLVYGLRPPALDQLGLLHALREQAAQAQRGGLQIRVQAPDTAPPLPAAVEVAAFRIAQEALTNVVRHAQAQHCEVIVRIGAALELAIEDDGCGIPAHVRAGVGLASMRERAEEIGGWCRVERGSHGGTRVSAELPLAGG